MIFIHTLKFNFPTEISEETRSVPRRARRVDIPVAHPKHCSIREGLVLWRAHLGDGLYLLFHLHLCALQILRRHCF